MRSTPSDGQSVGGQQQLGAQRGHAPQGERPLAGVALHLLGVAGVGEHPDEQVAGADRPVLGDPGPGVVVGLAPAVVQLEAEAADVEPHLVAVGDRRLDEVGEEGGPAVGTDPTEGTRSAAAAELALVDRGVVAVGEVVAGEALGDGLVADHRRSPVTPVGGLGDDGRRAADVVDVAVGVHEGVHGIVVPAAQGPEHLGAEGLEGGVEEHQTVVGAEGHDVGERLDDGDAVGHLGQLERDAVGGPELGGGVVPGGGVDEAGGQLEQVGHGVSRRRTWPATARRCGGGTRSWCAGSRPSRPTAPPSTGARGRARRRRAPWPASG